MFYDTDFLKNDEIYLKLDMTKTAEPSMGYVPVYFFSVINSVTGEAMGTCDLRIGYNENTYYGGNIGYKIYEKFRGRRYAAKACLLLFELAKKHGMRLIIITCDPDNAASRKTCEFIGCTFDKIIELPAHNEMYMIGQRRKCIYKIIL